MERVIKLFTAKGMQHANLWLEGDRLTQFGFFEGVDYSQVWYKNSLVLTTAPVIDAEGAVKTVRRTVKRNGNHPVIRIEGERVRRTFGTENVKCTFEKGRITIAPHHAVELATAA